jgi:endonuclease/exonuclease/phosphatase family metal-dependent hydrolase
MKQRSLRGALLVVGVLLLGGVVLGGLFLARGVIAKNPPPPAAPADAAWGAPARPLRIVSYNILHCQRGLDRIAAQIRPLDPDFVFLQEVESRDRDDLARALEMRARYEPQVYVPSENLAGERATWGNLILSKYPLYGAASIPNPGGGSFGIWADTVVDGRRFVVACVHLSATWKLNPVHLVESGNARSKELTHLLDAWQSRGRPPMIVAGDFNQIPVGNNYALMTRDLTDGLAAVGQTGMTFGENHLRTRIDYVLLSGQWTPTDGGIGQTGASDHSPIWLSVRAAEAAAPATTRGTP